MSSLFPTQNAKLSFAGGARFATYAMVPYLANPFLSGRVLLGGVGRSAHSVRRRREAAATPYMSIALGLLILCAQVLLWWVIVKVPEWTKGF